MKKLLLIVSCMLIGALCFAQQDSTGKSKPLHPEEMFCVILQKGKPVVLIKEVPVKADLKLANGNILTPTGTLVRKDKSIQLIKPGTCVNAEGNETEMADRRK